MVKSPAAERTTPLPTDGEAREDGGVTPRVVVLCLLLSALFGYLIPIIDRKMTNTYLGASHLPPGALAALLVMLVAINPLLRVLGSRRVSILGGFSRNELLTVYLTCLCSCLVPGHGGQNSVVSVVLGPFYFATRENKWLTWLDGYLPSWMTPAVTQNGRVDAQHAKLVTAWFEGLSGDATIPWGAWLPPLLAWGIFIMATYWMLACLSVMLRAQWAKNEALSFPLLRLPLEMTEENGARALPPFFHNPAMWTGFALICLIELLNGLNLYFPLVPRVPLQLDTAPLFTEAPWNQITWLIPKIWPIAVGVTFIITSEVAFSLWFFFLLGKAELVTAYYLGYPASTLPTPIGAIGYWSEKSFELYQQFGAYLVFVACLLWTARAHLRHVMLRALGRAASTRDEKDEALSYPAAFWGFALSFAFVIAWTMLAGVNWVVALAMWTMYLTTVIVLSRVVVEGGLLFVMQNWTPLGTLGQLFGSGSGTWLSASTGLVPASFVQTVAFTDLRGVLMPSFLQGFKVAHERRIGARSLLALIFACCLVSLAIALWMNVRLGYEGGALQLSSGWFVNGQSRQSLQNVQQLIGGAEGRSALNWLWTLLGGVSVYAMLWARARFAGFPLHPIGYLMYLSYPLHEFWFSIFLGWLCKVLLMRFGGATAYRKAIPFFLGVVFGEICMMLFWLAIDGWQGRQGHVLVPW